MMSTGDFERLIRRIANHLGVDIHRHRPEASQYGRLSSMLASHGVNLVLDIGANIGQFAQSIREAGYEGRLVSFEPLSAAHLHLQRNSRYDARWEVAPRIAIGDHEGEIEMHIARNSVSSSALVMLESHVTAAPDSAFIDSERVRLSRLDTVSRGYLEPGAVPFLKIDTQGYEDRVLDGATALLNVVTGLHLELSFVPLYEGQPLYDVLVDRLRALGFSIWGIWPGIHEPQSGRMLQVDVAFFRN